MRNRLPCLIPLTLTLLFVASPANSAILRVGAGCTYTTPQPAFDAARDGDTVRLRSGNYSGPFVIGWAIRVEGGYDDCSTSLRTGRSDFRGNAPSQSTQSLLRIPSLIGQVVLDRITVRDNIKSSGDGAGIHMTSASLAMNDVEIRDNRALDGNGGGIYLDNSEVELVFDASVLLEANRANAGGAIAANGDQSRVRFSLGAIGSAATFRNNRVNVTTGASPGKGSAIYLYNGADAVIGDSLIEIEAFLPDILASSAIEIAASPFPSGVLVRDSTMVHYGGDRFSAIAALGSNADIEIQDTVIDGWRSGLVLRDGNVLLTRVLFQNNYTNVGGNGGSGAGIRLLGDAVLEGHSLEFINNAADSGGAMAVYDNASWSISGAPGMPSRFVGNKAVQSGGMGGAIYHHSTGRGGINDYPLEWGQVEFRDNWAWSQSGGDQGRRGGAISVDVASAQLDLRSPLTFDDNYADSYGGAIDVGSGQLSLDARPGEQIDFTTNRVFSGDGGALYRDDGSTVLINGTVGAHGEVVFTGNKAQVRGGSIASYGAGSLHLQAPVRFLNPDGLTLANQGGQIHARASAGQNALVEFQGWDGSGRGIVIAGSKSSSDGAGMYLDGVTAVLDWVQFGLVGQPNQSFSGDGANLLAIGSDTDVTLRNSSLSHGIQFSGGGKGHGLLVGSGAQVLMESVHGVANTPPPPGGAWPCQASTLAEDRHCSEIVDNGTAAAQGGGVFVDTGALLSLRGVNIDGNRGTPGALLIENGGSVDALNVRVSRNLGGIELLAGAQLFAQHLTVAGNSVAAIKLADTSNTVLDLSNSVVWGNSGSVVTGSNTSLATDCNISQTAVLGLFADPGFVQSTRGRYRLGAGSPALDSCMSSLALIDLDGDSRPQGIDFDAGAFEGVSVPNPDPIFMDGFE